MRMFLDNCDRIYLLFCQRIWRIHIVCIATLYRDETLLATAYSSLDERGESRAMPEKRRKERKRKRERKRRRGRLAERAICIGMQAPTLRVTLALARAGVCKHARTYCAFDTYLRVNSQGKKPRVSSNARSLKRVKLLPGMGRRCDISRANTFPRKMFVAYLP